MLPTPHVKLLSSLMPLLHANHGAALIRISTLEPTDRAFQVVGDTTVVEGRRLHPKAVLGVLFRMSIKQKQDPNAVLWTLYDEEADTSVVGHGVLEQEPQDAESGKVAG